MYNKYPVHRRLGIHSALLGRTYDIQQQRYCPYDIQISICAFEQHPFSTCSLVALTIFYQLRYITYDIQIRHILKAYTVSQLKHAIQAHFRYTIRYDIPHTIYPTRYTHYRVLAPNQPIWRVCAGLLWLISVKRGVCLIKRNLRKYYVYVGYAAVRHKINEKMDFVLGYFEGKRPWLT